MKTRIQKIALAVSICALSLAVSCKTAPASPEKGIAPAAAAEVPDDGVYTRLKFGEKLAELVNQYNYEAALALFETVPEPDASDISIKKLYMSVLVSSGNIPESTSYVNELEAAFPQDIDILYTQALLAQARDEGQKRTAYLNKILTLQPNYSPAITALGLDFYARKNYPQARALLIRATAADPSNTEALLGLARVYYMENDLEKSLDALNLAILRTPDYSLLWAERARVQSERGEMADALSDIEKAIELDGRIYRHWIDYGSYLMTGGKRTEAAAAFSEAIRLDSDFYLAYVYRAGLNDDLGNYDQATSDYQNIIRLYPQYFYAFEGLGIMLWKKGDWNGSRRAFEQALVYNPKNTSYALMATVCMYRDQKETEAKNFMSKYLTTLDRASTDYFLCRLFYDRSAEMDVINRIMKETEINTRNRMLFYAAVFNELFGVSAVAQKYYLEVVAIPAPNFFEYRLSQWALEALGTPAVGTR